MDHDSPQNTTPTRAQEATPTPVQDCIPARWIDKGCATCGGRGKVGPYDGGVMRPCGPCDIPPAAVRGNLAAAAARIDERMTSAVGGWVSGSMGVSSPEPGQADDEPAERDV